MIKRLLLCALLTLPMAASAGLVMMPTGPGGGPPPTGYSLVASCSATAGASSGGTTATTSPGVDCSTADLIVVATSVYIGTSGARSVSDSSSNTYGSPAVTVTTTGGGCSNVGSALWFVHLPTTTGISSMTFTVTTTGTGSAPAIAVQGFKGSPAAVGSPLDQINSFDASDISGGTWTTVPLPASAMNITPVVHALAVSGMAQCETTGASTVASPYTVATQTQYGSGAHEGIALAYRLDAAAAPTGPAWTIAAGAGAATIASFKPGP